MLNRVLAKSVRVIALTLALASHATASYLGTAHAIDSYNPAAEAALVSVDLQDADVPADSASFPIDSTATPEPWSLLLLGSGLLVVGTLHRRAR
jgi:hypothetical protein